jgi:hypothetical protein
MPRGLREDDPDVLAQASSRPERFQRGDIVIQVWIFVVFMGGIVIGGLVANAAGVLPDAEQLEEQDRARFTKAEHSL